MCKSMDGAVKGCISFFAVGSQKSKQPSYSHKHGIFVRASEASGRGKGGHGPSNFQTNKENKFMEGYFAVRKVQQIRNMLRMFKIAL